VYGDQTSTALSSHSLYLWDSIDDALVALSPALPKSRKHQYTSASGSTVREDLGSDLSNQRLPDVLPLVDIEAIAVGYTSLQQPLRLVS
jgi:hypothetical protein